MNLHVKILHGPWTLRFDSKQYLKVYRHDTIPDLERYDLQSAPDKAVHSRWRYQKIFYDRVRAVKNAVLLSQGADSEMLDLRP